MRVDIDAGSSELGQRSTRTLLRVLSPFRRFVSWTERLPTSDVERLRYLSKRSKRDRQATYLILIEKFAGRSRRRASAEPGTRVDMSSIPPP